MPANRLRHTGLAYLRVATGHTLERTPTIPTAALEMKTLTFNLGFSVIRIRGRRLGTAGAEGLRGNEAY